MIGHQNFAAAVKSCRTDGQSISSFGHGRCARTRLRLEMEQISFCSLHDIQFDLPKCQSKFPSNCRPGGLNKVTDQLHWPCISKPQFTSTEEKSWSRKFQRDKCKSWMFCVHVISVQFIRGFVSTKHKCVSKVYAGHTVQPLPKVKWTFQVLKKCYFGERDANEKKSTSLWTTTIRLSCV